MENKDPCKSDNKNVDYNGNKSYLNKVRYKIIVIVLQRKAIARFIFLLIFQWTKRTSPTEMYLELTFKWAKVRDCV